MTVRVYCSERSPRSDRFAFGRLPVQTLLAAALLWLACGAGALGQGLPIPGLPGGLGGIGTPSEAPDPEAPEGPATVAPNTTEAIADPTQALIDILRDDAAREALIRELEAVSGRLPDSEESSGVIGPVQGPPEATTEDAPSGAEVPVLTYGERAVLLTRSVGEAVIDELEEAWLRLKRVPSTLSLSLRVLEGQVLTNAISEMVIVGVAIYFVLAVLRFAIRPLRRRVSRFAVGGGWTRRIMLRLTVSALDVVAIPLAIFIGIFLLFVAGTLVPGENGEPRMSDSQALFINSFAAVEASLVVLRLVLSPRTNELRIVGLPKAGVRSLWRMGRFLTYLLGYGQLLLVPIVTAGISVFVGRAFSAVLSAIVVGLLIAYVLAVRHRVAAWLMEEERQLPFGFLLHGLVRRWHWPVIVYLAYVFVTVLTRPGNVLLPLLYTTGQVALVLVVGGVLTSALASASSRRVRMPEGLAERLPLLEERVNQLFPAFLGIARFVISVVMLIVLLEVLGLQTLGGIFSSDMGARITNGLFSVLLVVGLLLLIWLGLTSWVDFRLNPFVGKVPTAREITLLTLLKNAATVALIVIGTIMSLAQLGMNVGPLIASAGVIGLAISFGAQRMVEDVFSGIFIQAEGAMNVGDVVDVGGTVGVVEKLTVRSVTLRDLSGVVHVIPFSSASKVSNYMRGYSYHVADIGVAYREEIEDVRAAMQDAFDELRQDADHGPHIVGDMEWFGLNSFGASELMVRARIKTVPGQQWGIGRAYNALVKRIFDERGIEIPFPHQTLYFGEDKSGKAPPLHLRMERRHPSARTPATADDAHAQAQTVHGADMPGSDDP